MSRTQQNDQHKPHRQPRKPKVKSRRSGRGGDHRSLKFQREQSRIDAEVYRLVSEGFQLAQAAAALGISEDGAGPAYRRAINSLRLATVEEYKGHALDRIQYRRKILYAEIKKRLRATGSDAKKVFDSADLRMLFDAANQLDVRESRLIGLDAPLKSLIGWTGIAPSDDLLTLAQLDNLSIDELSALDALLEKARNGNRAVVVESRPVQESFNAGFQLSAPVARATTPERAAIEPEQDAEERSQSMARLNELRKVLVSRDPLAAVSDPLARRKLIGEYNHLAARFSAPLFAEPNAPDGWGQ